MQFKTTTIREIQKRYHNQISSLDLEILISHVTRKSREFSLAHPEQKLSFFQKFRLEKLVKRRIQQEPISYLTGSKEFFGLNFAVNRNTLIPRPETELIIEDILSSIPSSDEKTSTTFADIGTGSGNIIISLASRLSILSPHASNPNSNFSFIGSDISRGALRIAKKNSKTHGLKNSIKFFHSDLLKNKKLLSCINDQLTDRLVIIANLPYLSKEIYENSPKDVQGFEPKSALFSPKRGLWHYEQLLQQIKKLSQKSKIKSRIRIYLEISPEQKEEIEEIAIEIFPNSKIESQKDLAGKFRICKINLQ
ncbi:MAG: peptide chain release factor N(5)-glutamine methyltransferase [Candidatus Moranbacteria bacterium]|nr:peptide chain release factor N(5)-glutamine methyltransferase [Candidatus Moranbacteria bacterium]